MSDLKELEHRFLCAFRDRQLACDWHQSNIHFSFFTDRLILVGDLSSALAYLENTAPSQEDVSINGDGNLYNRVFRYKKTSTDNEYYAAYAVYITYSNSIRIWVHDVADPFLLSFIKMTIESTGAKYGH